MKACDRTRFPRAPAWMGYGVAFAAASFLVQASSWALHDVHVVMPSQCFPADERPVERFADGTLYAATTAGASLVCPLTRDAIGNYYVGGRIYVQNTPGDGIDAACSLWACFRVDVGDPPAYYSCTTTSAVASGSGGEWLNFPNIPQADGFQIMASCDLGYNDMISQIVYWEDDYASIDLDTKPTPPSRPDNLKTRGLELEAAAPGSTD